MLIFEELVDLGRLQKLFEAHYACMRLGMEIMSPEGKRLLNIGRKKICTLFHHFHPIARQACLETNPLMRSQLEDEVLTFPRKCKNGMWDIAAPIKMEGQQVGTFFLGQFFFDDEPPDREFFRNQALSCGFDVDSYLTALEEVPIFSREYVKNALFLLVESVQYLGEMGMKTFRQREEHNREEEDRRKLESQIRHAQKLESLGVLAGGIAHDFNNLLVPILGNADMAISELSPVSPARENIRQIVVASKRAAELTRQMLAYSGKGKFVVEQLDLREILEEISHLLDVSISKNAQLRYNFAAHLPHIEGDATQIRQVIMNLIINASEALGEKTGFISVSTASMRCDRAYFRDTFIEESQAEGVYACLEVADTGCGMKKEIQDRIFDPFFTTKTTGRGLGMAAVLGIVRGHKGAIKIYSESGKGTTFKILFPAAKDDVASSSINPEEVRENASSGKVLLIDDEETVLSVGRLMLEKIGLEVLTARDGREGLELFKENPDAIDLVVLDLTMPHMAGEETFREMRRLKSNVKVLLCSGYNETEVIQRFLGKGLSGFIQKPYLLETFSAKVRKILSSQ